MAFSASQERNLQAELPKHGIDYDFLQSCIKQKVIQLCTINRLRKLLTPNEQVVLFGPSRITSIDDPESLYFYECLRSATELNPSFHYWCPDFDEQHIYKNNFYQDTIERLPIGRRDKDARVPLLSTIYCNYHSPKTGEPFSLGFCLPEQPIFEDGSEGPTIASREILWILQYLKRLSENPENFAQQEVWKAEKDSPDRDGYNINLPKIYFITDTYPRFPRMSYAIRKLMTLAGSLL